MNALGMSQVDGAQREIEVVAYSLWEAAGRPEGQAMKHWLEAEAQLRRPGKMATPEQAETSGPELGLSGRRVREDGGRRARYGLVLKSDQR